MALDTLEILALILIVVSVLKLIIFLVNPNYWYSFISSVYSKPAVASFIAFLLAMTVLYFLLISGVTIIEILAVCLFIALVIAIGLAKYADKLIVWVKEQDIIFVLKEVWLYTLVWLLLLAWGAGEMLFA
ncbi:MAG: hypothetical protein P8X88_02970 [Gammaproteobacteria bacterium]